MAGQDSGEPGNIRVRLTSQPRLVGREILLSQIKAELAASDRAGVVLSGEAGCGKTRLLQEASAMLQEQGVRSLTVQAGQSTQGVPLQALASAMASAGLPIPQSAAEACAVVSREHRRRPLLVCVDDAHYLDHATGALLAQLARERRCLLALAVTGSRTTSQEVLGLWKDGWLCRLPVTSLSESQLVAVCSELLAEPVEFTTAARFAILAQGNLIVLRELIDSALESGILTRNTHGMWADAGDHVGARLQELTAPRTEALSEAGRTALEALSLAQTLPLTAALRIADAAVWEELESHTLAQVEEGPEGADISLADQLVGRVTAWNVSALRRRRLLRQLLYTLQREGHAEGREVQFTLWRHEVGRNVAEGELLSSARTAWWSRDWTTAHALAEAAWRSHRTPAAGLLFSKILSHAGRQAQAHGVLDVLASSPEPHVAAAAQSISNRANILHALPMAEEIGEPLGLHPDALTYSPADLSGLQVQTTLASSDLDKAVLAFMSGDCRTAWKSAKRLLDDSDPLRVAVAGAVALPALLRLGRPLDCLGITPRLEWAMRSLDEADLPDYEILNIPVLTCYAEGITGRRPGAVARLRKLARDAATSRNTMLASRAGLALARLLFEQGEVAEAHRLFCGAGGNDDLPLVQQLARAGEVISALHLDDTHLREAAQLRLDPYLNDGPQPVDIDLALATCDMHDGRRQSAAKRLTEAGRRVLEHGALGELADVVHALTRIGHSETAAALCPPDSQNVQGTVDKIRIAFAKSTAMGSAKDVTLCAEMFEQAQAPLYAAEAWAVASRLHQRAHEPRMATAAAHRCAKARENYRGFPTFLLYAVEEREPLSNREKEIALLAAAGHTSQEIAQRLVVSPRTVDNHLYRIYRKLGIDNRRALRTLLNQRSDAG
ncbi:LuxR family transcriptional regulator [Streptomyces sp. SKN60]|uniref:LuxR family transcriptional regulator n=1 Tax=Streptomyces sp. SKN60 TaxID=2855506 RepID=UPI0022479A9B|nr:LuxR family transcriptional regulator [Streptomyces sp. SKN60]MCX2185033.1 LuxR family transcriptional regulator [Streptomyces sp. SKN60]